MRNILIQEIIPITIITEQHFGIRYNGQLIRNGQLLYGSKCILSNHLGWLLSESLITLIMILLIGEEDHFYLSIIITT